MSIAAPALALQEDDAGGTSGRSVVADDRGAIMVIGVFMAMLVTGFLYYIVGIGNTLVYRERLQDAADAIAFSGAVVHARGMNIIAMINIVLLILMTIFIAMRIVERAVFGLMVACGTLLILVCGEAVPALEAADQVLLRIIDGYSRGVLQPALQLGHTAQEAVRNTFPGIAQGRVVLATVSGTYRPPADVGLLLPVVPYRRLPVKPIPLNDPERPGPMGLNVRAGRAVGNALTYPLQAFIPSGIRSLVASWFGRIGTALGPPDRPSWRNYDLDIGDGSCTDGLPGQSCEYSQLRGVAVASNTPFTRNVQGVSVATLGRGAGGGVLGAFEAFTHVGLAQAEYYYDGTEDRDEWMWHMYWRARFRRVRLGGVAGSIPGLGAAASVIDRIIVH